MSDRQVKESSVSWKNNITNICSSIPANLFQLERGKKIHEHFINITDYKAT